MQNNKLFAFKWNSVLGRHLVATRNILPGEIIIDEEAIVQGPSPSATLDPTETICLGCYAVCETASTFSCCKCFLPFCSKNCLQGVLHSVECRVFCNVSRLKTILHEKGCLYQFINIIRCLATKIQDPLKWKQICELQSNSTKLLEDDPWSETIGMLSWDLLGKNVSTLEKANNQLMPKTIQESAFHCLGVLRTNSFSELRKKKNVENLYFFSSFMAHSCYMNTDIQFDPNSSRIVVMAARDIMAGEPITNTYVPFLASASERQRLISFRGFACACQRCEDSTEFNSFFSAVRCHLCSNLTLTPRNGLKWKCISCNNVFEESALQILSKLTELETKLAMISKTHSVSRLEEIEKENWLHPNHALLIQEKFQICQLQYSDSRHSEKELKLKLACAEHVLAVFGKIFPGNFMFVGRIRFHRWLASRDLQYLKSVDNELSQKDSLTTVKLAREAHEILRRGIFGSLESEMDNVLHQEYPELECPIR